MIDAVATRQFCLRIIAEVYGYEYRADWHADLDSLFDERGIYTLHQQGHFVVRKQNGSIVATAGLRHLSTHPSSWRQFGQRYANYQVGALWRVYVDSQVRGTGLGTLLVTELEACAISYGYDRLYLHTSWHNPDAVKFWANCGFSIFAEDDNDDRTVHMEKIFIKP